MGLLIEGLKLRFIRLPVIARLPSEGSGYRLVVACPL
jgi:hypothetical protein